MALIVRTQKREYDDREVTVYRAVLTGDNEPCMSGNIGFAAYEVWSDEPQEAHDKAKANTLANAVTVLEKLLAPMIKTADVDSDEQESTPELDYPRP